MKLLFIAHMWCPVHNAGGETTAHAALRAMVERGHKAHVICRPHTEERQFEDYEFEGVKVVRPPRNAEPFQWFKEYAEKYKPDVLLTHLDLTFLAEQLALDLQIPLAHFVHNEIGKGTNHQGAIGFYRVPPEHCQLAIYNSQWVSDAFAYKQVPGVVVYPVVDPIRYQCERGNKIAFINPTADKGADTFYELSKALPHRQFLVVKSVYGEQIAPPNINGANFPNVEVMEHVSDIREVFRKTRIVLMPSIYESYGRVPVEAACAGIPAIVHPTEGLLESLHADREGWIVKFARHSLAQQRARAKWEVPEQLKQGWVSGAGIFCDRNDIESWAFQIERLMADEVYYRSRSDAALALASTLNPESEFDRLEMALLSTVTAWKKQREEVIMPLYVCDKRYWETSDGNWVAEIDGRIPRDAVRLAAGIGTEIPETIARLKGILPPEAKAIEAPAENKAIGSPQETKSKRKAA